MARDLSRLRGLTSVNALTEGAQTGTILELDPFQVRVEKQVRKKFINIEDLAQSMKEEQQSPIIVSPLDKNSNTYLLQKGERRLRAAMLIGEGFKIKAIVDPTIRTKSKSTASQLAENIQREPLTPIEIAKALVELRTQMKAEGRKGTGREMAQYLSMPESWVSKHLSLSDLPDELEALIDDEITSDSELIQSLAKICELKPDLYLELIQQTRSDAGLSRSEAREHLKAARGVTSKKSPQATPDGAFRDNQQLDNAGELASSVGLQAFRQGLGASDHSQRSNKEIEQNVNSQGDFDTKRILHAKTFDGTNDLLNPIQCVLSPEGSSKGVPKLPDKKLGKTEFIEIPAGTMIMQVRVSTDKKQFTGELLLNVVCGDTNKGMVSYFDDGKQHKNFFDLDMIEIISLAATSM